MMTDKITFALQGAETYEEFIDEAYTAIAEMIAEEETKEFGEGITSDDVFAKDIEDRAKEIWAEWLSKPLPF